MKSRGRVWNVQTPSRWRSTIIIGVGESTHTHWLLGMVWCWWFFYNALYYHECHFLWWCGRAAYGDRLGTRFLHIPESRFVNSVCTQVIGVCWFVGLGFMCAIGLEDEYGDMKKFCTSGWNCYRTLIRLLHAVVNAPGTNQSEYISHSNCHESTKYCPP